MVKIEPSKCVCGQCREEFYMEWEFEVVDISEGPMGECAWYQGDGEEECPACGNILHGNFSATEYPAGELETMSEVEVTDSENTNRSEVYKPEIWFFDI